MRKLVLWILPLSFLVVVSLTGIIYKFLGSVPDVKGLEKCLTTKQHKVYLCDSSPDFVLLDEISPNIVGAVIMSEDAAFFGHRGFDLSEIKESMKKNLREFRYARGGSTITQQLAKNVFLTNEKSLKRKFVEIVLAHRLEKEFSKKQIITYYLNVVEFGPNLFGVKKASRYYFNKDPINVQPWEAAFLAFLLPSPKRYHQSFAQKELTPFASRMVSRILRKMYKGKKISEEDYLYAREQVPNFFGPGTGSVTSEEEILATEESDEEQFFENDEEVTAEVPADPPPNILEEDAVEEKDVVVVPDEGKTERAIEEVEELELSEESSDVLEEES